MRRLYCAKQGRKNCMRCLSSIWSETLTFLLNCLSRKTLITLSIKNSRNAVFIMDSLDFTELIVKSFIYRANMKGTIDKNTDRLIIYFLGERLEKSVYRPVNVFFRYRLAENSLLFLNIEMSRKSRVLLFSISTVNLIFG